LENLNPVEWAIRPFRRYAAFGGRSPRAEYWWYAVFVGIVGFLLGAIDGGVLHTVILGSLGPLGLTFTAVCVLPSVAVLVRRLHDTERNGWWALVKIPSYGLIMTGTSTTVGAFEAMPMPVTVIAVIAWLGAGLAVFLFVISEGTGGPNRYGPDPYGPGDLEEVFA
jgi:uncharacterized membrane protein YhaH (DUF805 family)